MREVHLKGLLPARHPPNFLSVPACMKNSSWCCVVRSAIWRKRGGDDVAGMRNIASLASLIIIVFLSSRFSVPVDRKTRDVFYSGVACYDCALTIALLQRRSGRKGDDGFPLRVSERGCSCPPFFPSCDRTSVSSGGRGPGLRFCIVAVYSSPAIPPTPSNV